MFALACGQFQALQSPTPTPSSKSRMFRGVLVGVLTQVLLVSGSYAFTTRLPALAPTARESSSLTTEDQNPHTKAKSTVWEAPISTAPSGSRAVLGSISGGGRLSPISVRHAVPRPCSRLLGRTAVHGTAGKKLSRPPPVPLSVQSKQPRGCFSMPSIVFCIISVRRKLNKHFSHFSRAARSPSISIEANKQ